MSKPMKSLSDYPKDCYSCELFYRKRDDNFDGCPHLSSSSQDGYGCPYVVKFNALSKLRDSFHKWFMYEDETPFTRCTYEIT
jgi:hypothetical protein